MYTCIDLIKKYRLPNCPRGERGSLVANASDSGSRGRGGGGGGGVEPHSDQTVLCP